MKNNRNLSLFVISLLLFQVVAGSIPITVMAEDNESNQESNTIVYYDMKETEVIEGKTVFKNLADEDFDGIYQNKDKGRLIVNDEVGFVGLDGGSANDTNAYIELPKTEDGKDVLSDLENVSITALVNWTNDGTNRWIYGFGRVDDDVENGNSYLFTTPLHGSNNSAATGISEAGWQNEVLVTASEAMTANQWNVVTSVFNSEDETMSLYVNGEEVAQDATNGLQLANIIDSKSSFSGFIGRSIFQNDDYFKGMIADFRIHAAALSAKEVANLSSEIQTKINPLNQLLLEDQKEQLSIESYLHQEDTVDQVTRDLNLPTSGQNGVNISWDSSHPDVVANDGTVQRPGVEEGDTVVELTANLSINEITASTTFEVTVLKEFSDQERVDLDATGISIYNPDNVKGNLYLPTAGEHGSDISWTSSHPAIIKGSDDIADQPHQLGWVDRPDEDTDVTLTANVQYNNATTTQDFQVQVKKDPGDKEYDAYFFSYFTGEYEGGEEISFAVAEDPLHWRALNNGQSVIQSNMGEEGLRDPFVIRAPEGDKFYMIATDLKMGESTNFDQAQITGSHSIMVWESDDLINWSEQRMVEVAPKNGGNTWAPEAFYHEPTGEYVVFWASSIPNEETYGDYPNGRPNGQYNVMYYATTRDFQTFSEPKVYIDDGFPTIDTTFIEHDETLYRFTKSEVNYKVYYEKAQDIFDDLDGIEENGYQFEEIPGTKDGNQGLIGHGGNNEGQTIFKAIDEDKWYLFLDSWPYHVRWTTDLEDGSQLVNNVLDPMEYALPPGPRHGTVIPITSDEYQTLTDHYLPDGPEPSDDPVVHYSFDEEEDGVITDQSGNGYDAILQGNGSIETEQVAGGSQGFVQLDGESGFVEMPENLIQQENLEKMTLSTWIKVDQNQADQRIFDFGSDTGREANRNSMYLSTQGGTGELEFAMVTPFTEKFANASADLPSDYKYRLDSSRLQLNQWQHVAVTIDGFNAKLFVNGEEVSSSDTFNVEPRMLMETTMNYLGKSTRNNQAYFAGGFDEFKLFNRALSANEIEALADELTIETPEEPEGPQSDPSLLLEYDMKNIDNNILQDQSGNFDGTLVNIDEDNVITTDQVGVIELTGEESYIEIPEGVLDDKESITVSTLVNWNGENSAEWLYTFGQNDQRYLYFTPSYNADGSARFGIATNGWQNEISTKTDGLKENEWKLVTTVFDGDANRLELYIDGELATSSEAGGYTLADIANMEGLSGYIGRSFYHADPYFKGVLADFKVYDGVLTTSDIDELKNEANEKIAAIESILVDDAKAQLIIDDLLGNNQSANEIMTDLDLPAKGSNNTAINWESSHPDIISEDGQVVRPANGAGNQTVTLTATITDGEVSTSKEFTFTVLEEDAAVIRLKEAIQSLIVHNIHDVRGNLTLPTEVGKNIEVTWESTDPEMITTTGEVTRPEHGEGDSEVTLTATLELDGEKLRKAFKAKVKELPEEQDYEGYVFPHFTGEGYENGEQIYFALSEGNNPLKWQQLNDGEPVFTSELGEEGLRDPFIIRSPEGDKFYMIATDLKIYGNGDWNRAQTEGSRSIMVWESNDLVNWSEQRMVEVAPKEAGNTWAPEIFFDDTTGEYIVFWASKLYEDENNRNNGDSYQRMMYSKTRDFYTFTEPEVYMDYGYSIIDTTMIEHDGKIYRFTKDERGYHPEDAPNGKFIFQEVGDSVLDPNFEMIKEGVGKEQISRGEGPAIFKSNTEEKWYLFIDEFGGRGYVPFETSDLDSGEWTIPEEYDLPDRPRHGTVLPITADEYQALSQQVPQEEKKKEDEVTSISFEENDIHLQVNETKQLAVNVTPDQPVDLLWTSTNEEVAEVNSDGKVTAVSIGEAYITVSTTDGLYVDVAKVVVTEQDPEETSNQLEIEQQKEVNAGETYYLQGTKVRIKMPEDLPEGTLLTIKGVDEEALTSEQNLQIAGDVYDFEIVYPEGAAEPKRPFGLTLGIEETYQEEEIAIYFYNASQHKWEKQVSDIDVEARTVTADVSHFSVYGVLQTIGQQNETPDDDNDQSAQPPSNNNEKTSNTNDNQSGKSADGTQQQQESNQQTDQNNKDLPNTATMLFNWLLLGAILLAIGLGLYFMRKRNVM